MKMFFDPVTRYSFSVDQLKRIVKMLAADDSPYFLIRFIEGLTEIEVPDNEN